MNFEEEREAWQKLGLNFFHYHVDLEFPEYTEKQEPLFFTKVNGATINQEKKDAFLNLDNLVEGKYYNGCFCTLEDGDKLGNFFDRLPYGIINKKITGIGATTLELKSARNSIIVLPTKAFPAQAEVHDRGSRLPSGERPERQIQTCACHQWATDWRMVQGTVWQAVLIH